LEAALGFKMKITVPKTLEKNVAREINRIIQDDEVLNGVGEIARKDAVAHILQAKEPATGNKFSRPTITKTWQTRKKRLSTVNSPIDSRAGGGGKTARLAFTGQFVKSFIHNITRSATGRKVVEVGPQGMRTQYRNLNGSSAKGPRLNETLGDYLIDQGRDWRGVPERIKTRINTAVRAYIRKKLRSRKS
jgi:hypothetical protein